MCLDRDRQQLILSPIGPAFTLEACLLVSICVGLSSQAQFDLNSSQTEPSSHLIWSRTSFLLSWNPDVCKWELMLRSSRKFFTHLLQSETDCLPSVLMGSLHDCFINPAHIYLISKHHGIKQNLNIQTWCQSSLQEVPSLVFLMPLKRSNNLMWGENSQRVLKKNSCFYIEHTHTHTHF